MLRGKLLLALSAGLLLLNAGPATAAITIPKAWSNIYSGTAYPGTISYPVPAGSGNRMLVIAVTSSTTTAIAQTLSVTYGTRSLTLVRADGGATQAHTYLFYLNEAGLTAASNTNLVFTFNQTSATNNVYAAVFDGVDQSASPISANQGGTGTTSVAIPSLAVGSGDLAVEVVNMSRTGGTTYRTITTPAPNWATAVGPNQLNNGTVYTSGYLLTDSTAGSTTAAHTISSGTASIYSMSAMSMKAAPTVVNTTAAGTVTAAATAGSCTGLTLTASYTNDANGNNTLSYRYRTPAGTGLWQGPFTRAHSASPYNFPITGLTYGAAYDVEVTYVDADGVTGTATQIVTNVVGEACTAAGTVAASQTPGATPSIAVSAPYSFDTNGNNTLSYRYRTPSGTGAWTAATPLAHAASPYTFTLSNLTCGSSYDVEVTYADADGIGSGTVPQTVSSILMNNCTVTGAVTATGSACGSIAVTAPYTQDADGDNTISYRYRTPTGTGVWTAPVAVPHAVTPYSFSITGLAAGSYDVEVTYADADGLGGTNPRAVTNVTVTAGCTVAGAATIAATAGSCTGLTLTAPYTGDANATNTLSYRYRTPAGTGVWQGPFTRAHSVSPYTVPITGLTPASSYDLEVTYVDADGVTGTNPQALGPVSTGDCRAAPQTPTATANTCNQVVVSAPFSGDANNNSTTSVDRGTAPAGPFSTAICAGVGGASPRTCTDNTAAASTTYYYRVVFTDADGVNGAATQVVSATTPVCAANNTIIGSVTAQNSSCSSVVAYATFTGDANGNGSTSFEYNTTNSWPGSAACTVAGASPRTCTITGLLSGNTYWVRATFTDADGVTGVNPTAGVSTGAALPACGANPAAPTMTLLVPSRNAIISGQDVFKIQVYDVGGLAATNPVQWSLDGGAYAAGGVVASANYGCGASCTVFEITVPAVAVGAHYVVVRATDASGNNAFLTVPFQATAAGVGSGRILRRTASSQLCLDCHNLQTHNSQYTSTTYGNWAIDCATCHTPHATANIFLVRQAIETPNSGTKTVSFQNTTGVASASYATPTASGNGVNVCEVCHTRTKNADATPRSRNNAATDWTKHYTGRCTGCHPHSKGFAAGESEGSASCAGCHKSIWDRMQAAGGSAYKHTLAVNAFNDDTTVTWASPLDANAPAARSCVNTCHDDHLHTAADDPSPNLHYNLAYDDSTSYASRAATTRTVATKAKTDFDNTLANGGLCVSCHRFAVESGATPTHPPISQAAYAVSAHNTTSTTPGGAWQLTLHDGSNFTRNCTKCHWDAADGTTPAVSGTTAIGGVHGGPNPSLLMGTTNPASVPGTFVCYRCHGDGTTGVNYSNKQIAPQIAKARNHPSNADTVHNSSTEYSNAGFGNTLGVTPRHANCLDCHDPHEAKAGLSASPGNLAGGALNGAWGAQLSANPAFWTDTASTNFTKKAIVSGTDVEATLCFKCHTKYYWGAGAPPTAPSGGPETDVAKEFNPNNVGNYAGAWAAGETAGGFHPVLATAGSNLGTIKLANLVTANFPWSTTARNLMTCSDCHASNATTDPGGPHGSTAGYILKGPNTAWNGTIVLGSSIPAGTFCLNCHQNTFANSRFPDHSRSNHFVACWNCHSVVPHGGPRPGMLIAPAGVTATNLVAYANWDTAAPYWGLTSASTGKLYLVNYPANNTTNWGQNNCGCNGTGH